MKDRTTTFAPNYSGPETLAFSLLFRLPLQLRTCHFGRAAPMLSLCNGLSGSERVSHTGATGLRLQEAGSINRSLAALSDVIKVGHQSDTKT